jgi:hypothetical protein
MTIVPSGPSPLATNGVSTGFLNSGSRSSMLTQPEQARDPGAKDWERFEQRLAQPWRILINSQA